MHFFMILDDEDAEPNMWQSQIDERLFIRIGENDQTALAELYCLTERAVYAFLLSILRDPYVTQDILQETYLKIRSAAHLYQPQGKPLAWIFTIAKNLAYSDLRKNKNNPICDLESLENNPRYATIYDPTDRLVLLAALTILREEEREIVLLHVISGITHRELASTLNLPLSTVISRYHRALKKLKKHLTKKGEFR